MTIDQQNPFFLLLSIIIANCRYTGTLKEEEIFFSSELVNFLSRMNKLFYLDNHFLLVNEPASGGKSIENVAMSLWARSEQIITQK